MRRRAFLLLLCVVFVVCIGILLNSKQHADPQTIHEPTTAVSSTGEPSNMVSASSRPGFLVETAERGRWILSRQKAAQKNNGPVQFYASVVDQNGAPVPGALLTGVVSGYNAEFWMKAGDVVQTSKFQAYSGNAGEFEIKRDRGIWLNIANLEKTGYFWQHPGFGGFGVGNNAPTRVPSYSTSNQPLVLHLWKKGATEPTLQCSRSVRVTETDSEYAINLFFDERGGETIAVPDLRIKLRYVSPNEAGRQYDREMVLETPSDGLVETGDAYLFLAVEGGYQKELKYYVKPTDLTGEKWKRKFYVRARNGRIYAGLEIQFSLFPHVIDIKAIINPTGSRNLEPDPSKQITDPEEIRRLDEATRVK